MGQNLRVIRSSPTFAAALRWVGDGPIYSCNERARTRLVEALDGLGYEVVELEGERIVSQESFADLFARAFGLPDGTGPEWETLAAVRPEQLGRGTAERVAIVWRRADHSAAFNLKCVVEAGAFILGWARSLERSEALPTREVVLFLCGQTRDFPHPPPGWTPEAR